jgi:hypothetical protein
VNQDKFGGLLTQVTLSQLLAFFDLLVYFAILWHCFIPGYLQVQVIPQNSAGAG